MKAIRKILIVLNMAACFGIAGAAVPANYYSKCENKSGAGLLSSLCETVGPHTTVSYNALWDVYKTSDVKPNGKIWDMYSTKEWTPGSEQCGNYSKVGDCYNREHSMPKSWFNDASPMVSDAFHIYPTDGKVNGQRSNYPYGECANGTTLASNGSVKALGKLGRSTFSGYSGDVFEPDDEYKGDFARSYFYMAAAYNDKISGWNSEMLNNTTYPAFTSWAVELLLKWHRQDPVSQKELDRNEAVYAYQHNRNPFIDHPELAEYIWGDKKSEKWSASVASKPKLSLPVDGSTVELGTVAVGVARSFNVVVKGSMLTGTLRATLTDANGVYSVSPSTLAASAVNAADGTVLSVTVNAKAQGTYAATLTLTSAADDINTKVTLSANAMSGFPATAPTDITDRSFIAHWTYIGDADKNNCYTIYILDADGNDVDTYPRSVDAKSEQFIVDELEPSTDYVFYMKNNVMASNKVSVRTADPMPNIQILYDGSELTLSAEPGVPSEAVELSLDIENVYQNITFSVESPFQISSDKSNWGQTLTVDPREDRIYLRLFGDDEGTFTTAVIATAGTYTNDDFEVTGVIGSTTAFLEDFENEGAQTGSYNIETYKGNACEWKLNNAGVYNVKGETHSGEYYLRFGNNSTSSAAMASDRENGIGTVKLYASGWSTSDGSSKFVLQYSTDRGATWTDAGSEVTIDTPASSTKEYKQYTFAVNKSGKVRLRIQQTYGKRMCIDDIEATNFASGVDDVFGDENGTGWDAYCANGVLVVELSRDAAVAVHGVDGITYLATRMASGHNPVSLQPGLYIVAVGDATRRVLVK